VPLGADRLRHHSHRTLADGTSRPRHPVRGHERHRFHQAPRQHFALARRRGREDRSEGVNKPAAGPRLSDRQRLAWLKLIRTPNVGPASFRDLINRFGSADTALEMLPELTLAGGGGRMVRVPSVAEAEAELEAAARCGARFVGIGEPDYPPLLKRMDHPPPLLAVKGEPAVFSLPPVAIVGARNASLAG